MRRLAITPGEPAGIGPEIVVRACQSSLAEVEWVAVADHDLLAGTAAQLGLPLTLHPFDAAAPRPSGGGHLTVAHVALAEPARAGELNPANAAYVLECLARASDLCAATTLDALVTGPVHKAVINEAGLPFSGHTEFFAQRAGVEQVVMMLATEGLRVALATTHLPLKDVPAAITHSGLTRTVEILHHDLVTKFGLPAPRILVAGLNPHAGEAGHLGREEIEVIEPVLAELRARGFDLVGPLPADTLFTPKYLSGADAVLAMYHDQGLPVLKFKGFGRASNITLGLPYIRTSVDHGTALDLAGKGVADLGSFFEALHAAERMARARAC